MSIATEPLLEIRELGAKDERLFLASLLDWHHHDRTWMSFDWKPGMSHEDHLKILFNHKNGLNLPVNFVASTMLYGFFDEHIIGRVHLRHELNENLLLRGGHMGYAVSEKYRNRGFGLQLAKAGYEYLSKELKIKKVLITCATTNRGSIHIIESLGAKLENIVKDENGVDTCRYWI